MSVYGSRRKRTNDLNVRKPVECTVASVREAAAPIDTAEGKDWSPRRKVKPVNYLLPHSLAWLESLPPAARPLALATKYPRIVNRIALAWNEPGASRANFDDLVYDSRGSRQGFPPDVHRDLLALREYYYGYAPPLAQLA